MPYKDPADNKAWLRRRLDEGYGKALYRRRKQHLENERILRESVVEALAFMGEALDARLVKDRARLYEQASSALERGLDQAPPVVRTPMSILGEIKDSANRQPGGPKRKKGGK